MNRNGSNLVTEKAIQDNFPIGLVVLLNDTSTYTFRLVSINEYALQYLCIPSAAEDLNAHFFCTAKAFKLYNISHCLNLTLYDYIISKQRQCECSIESSLFINEDKLINVKMKQLDEQYYLTIDTISDDRKIIRQKLIASIRKNFLMTINHELKNYLCGLITTLEETKMLIEEKDFMIMTVSVLLIKKIVKLYIIYNKTCLDEIRSIDLKLGTKMDFSSLLLKTQVKFTAIFIYKNVQINPFSLGKTILVNTDKHYIKDLLFVMFYLLYYKAVNNSVITMEIEYPSDTSCLITFINDLQSSSQIIKDQNDNDDIKKLESQIKKTVLNSDILQYLLMTISKFLRCDIELFHLHNERTNSTFYKTLNKRMISLKLNNIEIQDSIVVFNEQQDIIMNSQEELKSNVNIFIEQIQALSNRNGLSELQFAKKNTYDIKPCGEISNRSLPLKSMHKEISVKTITNKVTQDFKPSNILSIPYQSKHDLSYSQENLTESRISQSRFQNLQQVSKGNQPFTNSDFEISDDNPPSNKSDDVINGSLNQKRITIRKYQQIFDKGDAEKLDVINRCITPNPVNSQLYCLPYAMKISNPELIEGMRSLSANCRNNCNDIAVVDDEQAIAASVMRLIKSQNCGSDYCHDGKDLIEKIKSKLSCTCDKRHYKLILLDVYMNNWGGIVTCAKLNELIEAKTIPPEVKIVFISGHRLKDLDLPSYQFVKGFYQKPVNKATILRILHLFYLENEK